MIADEVVRYVERQSYCNSQIIFGTPIESKKLRHASTQDFTG